MRTSIAASTVLFLLVACGDAGRPTTTKDSGPDWWHIDRPDRGPDMPPPDTLAPDVLPPDLMKMDLPKMDLGPKLDVDCFPPTHPFDCSQVTLFQCGFMATCSGSKVKAEWHEHWWCGGDPNGMEQITSFQCEHSCPDGCKPNVFDWPQSGAELVKLYCNPPAP